MQNRATPPTSARLTPVPAPDAAPKWRPGQARRARAAATTGGPVEAVVYTRVSKEEQRAGGVSLDAQAADCARYVAGMTARYGWLPGAEFRDVLQGWRDDRTGYADMLAHVRTRLAAGGRVVVVVAALDRLGRRLAESVRCREALAALGVDVHTVREGGRVDDLTANILASVAQSESDRLSMRMSATKQHLLRNGWHPWGRPPFGYRWRPATADERAAGAGKNVLAGDPVAAPHVVDAFERLAAGDSLRAVGRRLAALPEDVRRGAGGGNHGRGRAFGAYATHVLSRNPVYAGRTPPDAGGASYPGRWEPLVPPELWERAQAALDRHRRLPNQASLRFLLTGFVRCPVCGGRMAGSGRHMQGRRPRYTCIGKDAGATAPDAACQRSVLAPDLDAAVLAQAAAAVAPFARPSRRTLRALQRVWDDADAPARRAADSAAAELRRAEQARDGATRGLTVAALRLVQGDLDKAGYELARGEFERRRAAAEDRLAGLRGGAGDARDSRADRTRPLPPLAEVLRSAAGPDGWATVLAGADVASQRAALDALVETVRPVPLGRGRWDADVAWTPLGDLLHSVAAAVTAAAPRRA